LVLVGVRLGIDGVNPVYHESIKKLFTFPQSVGIAGGRPSSSYYFVGYQADQLFYLDPHHTRACVPLQSVADNPVINYYANSYAFSDIRTYHCDRVRKMAITSLDPSMLLGFLCRTESEW
ncbi:uncharacterized protein EI90DRAFT_2810383, partial [Cantharellus anzutake]|uniref:uncharacterized protein n=1 Tax=Cantharellus anzutake TaxID=1750568 RepID=UPI0019087F24